MKQITYLDTHEAGERLGKSHGVITSWCAKGYLPCEQNGGRCGHYMIDETIVDSLVAAGLSGPGRIGKNRIRRAAASVANGGSATGPAEPRPVLSPRASGIITTPGNMGPTLVLAALAAYGGDPARLLREVASAIEESRGS